MHHKKRLNKKLLKKKTVVGQRGIKETEKGMKIMWHIVRLNTTRRTISPRTPRRPVGLAIRRSLPIFNLQVTT